MLLLFVVHLDLEVCEKAGLAFRWLGEEDRKKRGKSEEAPARK